MLLNLLISLLLFKAGSPTNYFSSSQYQALFDLYNATQGWNWKWSDSGAIWNFSGPAINPCSNNWQGLSCVPNSLNSTLSHITLQDYNLHGSLPSSVRNFVNLTIFDLSENQLTGQIPASLFTLNQLEFLILDSNQLIGSLPASVGGLTHLLQLNLLENKLSGQIPTELYQLTNLVSLDLSTNQFSGTVSDEIGNLLDLRDLQLSNNNFSSSLPDSIYSLSLLTVFNCEFNHFTGTLSSNLADAFPLLRFMAIASNDFFGPLNQLRLPSSFQYVDIGTNLFGGSLPAQLTDNLPLMNTFLAISKNSLTGTISEQFLNSSRVNFINADRNFFHGPLNYQDEYLRSLLVDGNQFSGPLPLPNTELLQYSLRNNFFSGTIPSDFWSYFSYADVDLSVNCLSGNLQFSSFTNRIESVNASFNSLNGRIILPSFTADSNVSQLQTIALSNNGFTGALPLDWTQFPGLSTFEVSNNQFTGNIPSFFSNVIQITDMSSNCFSGDLPLELCNPEYRNFSTLIMNGLSSSSACRVPVFPHTIIHTFYVKNRITGGLPLCLFALKRISSLYLSGNQITGTIPAEIDLSQSLLNLDLSHNSLSGTIPTKIQTRYWETLDLSYNYFGGTLSSEFHSYDQQNASLHLEANRLSGSVPSSLLAAPNINILDGNIFACNFNSNLLPENDPEEEHYSCGSDSVNLSIYIWLSFIGTGFCVVLGAMLMFKKNIKCCVIFLSCGSFLFYLRECYLQFGVFCEEIEKLENNSGNAEKESREGRNVLLFKAYNEKIRYTAVLLTAFILVFLLPAFGILPYFFGIYHDKYIWVISALFLEDKTAGIALFLLLFSFLLFTGILFVKLWFPHLKRHLEKQQQQQQENNFSMTVFYFLRYFLLGLGNFIAMLLVDLGYVYVVINYNTVIITFTEVCLSVVKVGWNNVIIWHLLRYLYNKLLHVLSSFHYFATVSRRDWKQFPDKDISILSFNIGLNNLIYPCFALIILSTNCFYNAFYPAPAITSSYSYPSTFKFIDEQTTALNTESSSFSPPFEYSYECSSTIYAYYCPIFILMFLIESVLIPMWELPKLYKYALQDQNSLNNGGTEKISKSEIELVEKTISETVSNSPGQSPSFLHRQSGSLTTMIRKRSASMMGEYTKEKTARTTIFHKNHYIVKFNSYFLILIIYGSVFPVLAIVGLISIYIRTKYEELLFGHYLLLAKKKPYSEHQILFKLNRDCSNMFSSCHYTFFMIFFISMFVFSFLIFDSFGRNTSVAVAMVPTIVFFSSFLLVLICWSKWKQLSHPLNSTEDINIVEEVSSVENPIIEQQ
jgi:Leucine-rich repeat (LRR) protein